MHQYAYKNISGHIIIDCDDLKYLIDTGAPNSVALQDIRIAGRGFSVEPDYMGVSPEFLSEQIGAHIDGLIGADVMHEFEMVFDSRVPEVRFDIRPCEFPIFMELDIFMGIPIITASVNSKSIRAFFDTGAPLSYIDPRATTGVRAHERKQDFYPGFGSFETDVFNLETEIAGCTLNMEFGHLPDILNMTLMLAGTQGIIGSKLLDYFVVGLSVSKSEFRLLRIEGQ